RERHDAVAGPGRRARQLMRGRAGAGTRPAVAERAVSVIGKQDLAAPALRPRRRERRELSLTGLIIVGLFVLLALVGPFVAPMDPMSQDLANRLAPPSGAHLLGTDALGRDVLSRILVATRIDLPIGIAAASISAILGIVIGAAGGYLGGALDTLLMRLGDLIMAFPTYVLIV